MGKTMPPSKKMTDEQVNKLSDLIKAKLRKLTLPCDASQQVIESQGKEIALSVANNFKERVKAISGMIVRRVRVNRSLAPQQILVAIGRSMYTNNKVVESMPRGMSENAEVYFFKVGRYISDAQLEKEYSHRGLIPADMYSLATVNEAHPIFADDHPNGTHWRDSNGIWCFGRFCRSDDFERYVEVDCVEVDCNDDYWNDFWWFAGVRM